MKNIFAIGFALLAAAPTLVSAQTMSPSDISEIVGNYRENQARFSARYKGREFSGQVVFAGASENIFLRGRFMAKFKYRSEEINCWIEKKADVDRLVDLNKGDPIYIQGVVDDVVMGDLQLKPCIFKKL